MSKNPLINKKQLLTATLLATLIAAPVWAGDQGEHQHGPRLDYIFSQLELSEEQRSEVQTLLQDFRSERREAMKTRREAGEPRPSREEMLDLRETHQRELAERLSTVLTAEQVEEFTTYLEAHRPHHQGMKKHHDRRSD